MLSQRLLMAQLRSTPEAVLQQLTGSGTFTPLFADVPAIIQISGGGGGGGAAVWAEGSTGRTPGSGRRAAGVNFFVPDINVFSGGSYIVGSRGSGGSLCSSGNAEKNGATGGTSLLSSPGNNPWRANMPGGGRGLGNGGSSTTAAASGPWPIAPFTDLPDTILLDNIEIDPSTLLSRTASNGGSYAITQATGEGPNGSRPTGCAYASFGISGFVNIYYLT